MVVRFKNNHTVSAEGFVGDLLGKIKGALKGRPKLPSETESTAHHIDSLVKRLKETVLNEKWLSEASFKTGKVSSVGILPQLSYKGKFDESNPIAFINKSVQEVDTIASRYMQEIKRYDAQIQQIHSELSKKTAKYTEEDDAVVEPLIEAAIKKITALPFPSRVLPNKIDLLGFTTLIVDSKTGLVEETYQTLKFDSIPTLTTDTAKDAAALVIKLCGLYQDFSNSQPDWIDHSDGSKFWDTVTYMDHVDDYSNLVYFQSLENRLEYWSFYLSYSAVITALVKWLNLSIK